MDVIFQKKDKEILKKGKTFENLGKNVQTLKNFEEGRWLHAIIARNKLLEQAPISDLLPDQVWWYNMKRFLSSLKNASTCLCERIHDIINYSTFICPFEFGKYGKEGKK